MNPLERLLRPRSIAVIGGGPWCRSVIAQSRAFGFTGQIWPVHPTRETLSGVPAVTSVSRLPSAPDAAFIGVNRDVTIEIVRELANIGAGGAVCFASGFREAESELPGSTGLEVHLRQAAGTMPILGPNCYGFINALDGALLWPDQHGLKAVSSGVAILTQSSNMAINVTMQCRALPIAFIATVGNQAQTGMSDIGMAVLEDDRITGLGMHVEGFGNLAALERLAERARTLEKPVTVLKVGRSSEARAGTLSHTASIAGSDAGAGALIERLGFSRSRSLPGFLETLKLLHIAGPLPSKRIATVSCSGGEASLAADSGFSRGIVFPELNDRQKRELRNALGPRVALANPLDYHTYVWRDAEAMARAWSAIVDPSLAMTLLIVDFPRTDRCKTADWDCAIAAALETRRQTGGRVAMVSTLPELLPEPIAADLANGGVVPLNGLDEALDAVAAAAGIHFRSPPPLLHPASPGFGRLESMTESEAKAVLARHGLAVPRGSLAENEREAGTAATEVGFPVVLKTDGKAHKTEVGGVVLNLGTDDAVVRAASGMRSNRYLVEEMITGAVAELLVGVVRDPAHGYVLTVGAGGIRTELFEDRQSLLIPSTAKDIADAIGRLRITRELTGWRGRPAADMEAVLGAVLAIQDTAVHIHRHLEELEVNPLLCCPDRAVAADALLVTRRAK
ncbi:MAG: acetate--CoA ligase family protein [Paracoccaceae bacterium]|nr:acetate--CoA ligase family protein [Paracoccaceae bacterium]